MRAKTIFRAALFTALLSITSALPFFKAHSQSFKVSPQPGTPIISVEFGNSKRNYDMMKIFFNNVTISQGIGLDAVPFNFKTVYFASNGEENWAFVMPGAYTALFAVYSPKTSEFGFVFDHSQKSMEGGRIVDCDSSYFFEPTSRTLVLQTPVAIKVIHEFELYIDKSLPEFSLRANQCAHLSAQKIDSSGANVFLVKAEYAVPIPGNGGNGGKKNASSAKRVKKYCVSRVYVWDGSKSFHIYKKDD